MPIVNVRIDDKLKRQAAKAAARLGLDLSSAIRLFLRNLVATERLPFNVGEGRARRR
jgi:DNA-damage-inducible protein J